MREPKGALHCGSKERIRTGGRLKRNESPLTSRGGDNYQEAGWVQTPQKVRINLSLIGRIEPHIFMQGPRKTIIWGLRSIMARVGTLGGLQLAASRRDHFRHGTVRNMNGLRMLTDQLVPL